VTFSSASLPDADEDFYGPIERPNPFLHMHSQWKDHIAPSPVRPKKTRKRGRPKVGREASIAITDLSPRELVRNDLVEVAQQWGAVVSHVRANSLNRGLPARAASAKHAAPSRQREQYILKVVQVLVEPNSRIATMPIRSAAVYLSHQSEFAGVGQEAIRKYIVEAKKRVRC
jgi:hypothetical protein